MLIYLSRLWLFCVGPLVVLHPIVFLYYLAFKYLGVDRTWWRLFQKRSVRTQFDTYVHIFIINQVSVAALEILKQRYMDTLVRTMGHVHISSTDSENEIKWSKCLYENQINGPTIELGLGLLCLSPLSMIFQTTIA
jgi:hypothetical protein